MPDVPNQPSEAAAHFFFELAKNILVKGGGNSSNSLFMQVCHCSPFQNRFFAAVFCNTSVFCMVDVYGARDAFRPGHSS